MTPESMKTMQNDMDLEFDPRRVANFLKQIINANCEEGFKWFADVRKEPPTAYDLLRAIDVLEHTKDCIEKLPSAQPDEEKISDILYNIYRGTSPHTSAEGVAAIKYYIAEIWREIYGEEGPKWLKK